MKKLTLIIISLFLLFSARAQLFNIAGFGVGYLYLGPKLGGNLATSTIDVGSGNDKVFNLGYQFGAVAKLGITNKLSIQPELLYTSKGYGYDNSGAKTRENYKYIGLPVIAKYAFLAISNIQIYGSGGFYTDVLTGITSETTFVGTDQGETIKITDFSPYRRVDFGFDVGVGANIPFKNGDELTIDLAYMQGVVNVEKNSTSTSSKNTAFQISAIYLVDLTRFIHFKGKSSDNDAYEEGNTPVNGSKVE